jgi:hypothetical protein
MERAQASTRVPTYDYSQWPVFVVKMPPNALSLAELQAHLVACEEPYRRGQSFSWVIDLRDAPPPPAAQRKALAEAMREHSERYPGLVRGVALVVRTAFERGVVTAISWLSRPPYPQAVFDNFADARAWATRKLVESKP